MSGFWDLTNSEFYNVLEALRAADLGARALSGAERDIHDRGLVTLIRQHHDAIDSLVARAYGWDDAHDRDERVSANPPRNGEVADPRGLTEGAHLSAGAAGDERWAPSTASRSPSPFRGGLTDEDILTRLVALNRQRAAEEAKGLIRWLRPEFQAPGHAAPIEDRLDLGEAAPVLPDTIIPWPDSLPERVSAVQSVLAASAIPLAPADVARAFRGKRAASVRPVLDALAGIGMARRLGDGRYAA